VLHFLKAFLDIVLWRRGPQDLPASRLLLWLTAAAYVAVSVMQLTLLEEPAAAWVVFVVLDPVLLTLGVYLLLKLFGKTDRFLQTATAVLGTGVVLGLGMFLPVQWLLIEAGATPESTVAGCARDGGDAAHERATDAEDVQVQSQPPPPLAKWSSRLINRK
jgi:hypothetical protein